MSLSVDRQIAAWLVGAPTLFTDIFQRDDPLKNAVGSQQRLSDRFDTLEEARRTFPRARSLADYIDWHAFHLALDETGMAAWGPDTTIWFDRRGVVEAGQKVYGGHRQTSRIAARNGFPDDVVLGTPPDVTEAQVGIELVGFTLDGRKAANSAADPSRRTGLYVARAWSSLFALDVVDVQGSGVMITGEGVGSRNVTIDVSVLGCRGNHGIRVAHAMRDVEYRRVYARANTVRDAAIVIDHSEASTGYVNAEENVGRGIWIRHVHSNGIMQLTAQRNAGVGIWVDRFTYSMGAVWLAQGNATGEGYAESTSAEVLFDGNASEAYGVTRRSVVVGLSTALNPHLGTNLERRAAWGVWIGDGVKDVTIRDFNPGDDDYAKGRIRIPADFRGYVEEVTRGRRVLHAGFDQPRALTSAQRPDAASLPAGTTVFDTSLGRPLWASPRGWVDASGDLVRPGTEE